MASSPYRTRYPDGTLHRAGRPRRHALHLDDHSARDTAPAHQKRPPDEGPRHTRGPTRISGGVSDPAIRASYAEMAAMLEQERTLSYAYWGQVSKQYTRQAIFGITCRLFAQFNAINAIAILSPHGPRSRWIHDPFCTRACVWWSTVLGKLASDRQVWTQGLPSRWKPFSHNCSGRNLCAALPL